MGFTTRTRDQNANVEKRLKSVCAFARVVACAQCMCTTGPRGLGNHPGSSGVQGQCPWWGPGGEAPGSCWVFWKIEWLKPLPQAPLDPYPHTPLKNFLFRFTLISRMVLGVGKKTEISLKTEDFDPWVLQEPRGRRRQSLLHLFIRVALWPMHHCCPHHKQNKVGNLEMYSYLFCSCPDCLGNVVDFWHTLGFLGAANLLWYADGVVVYNSEKHDELDSPSRNNFLLF